MSSAMGIQRRPEGTFHIACGFGFRLDIRPAKARIVSERWQLLFTYHNSSCVLMCWERIWARAPSKSSVFASNPKGNVLVAFPGITCGWRWTLLIDCWTIMDSSNSEELSCYIHLLHSDTIVLHISVVWMWVTMLTCTNEGSHSSDAVGSLQKQR